MVLQELKRRTVILHTLISFSLNPEIPLAVL